METKRNGPFFVYLPYYAVHTPIQGKKELVDKYRKKPSPSPRNDPAYAAMIENMDTQIGRLLTKITELDIDKKTLLIFSSDNGPYFPVTTAEPLRGSKGMLYEGGIRVPLAIRWPGKIRAGAVCEDPVMGIDFFPTLLEFTGVKTINLPALDGVSLTPLLFERGKLQREALFWHFPAYLENYKGMAEMWRQTPGSAVRKGDWKLIERFETGELELYNLASDLGETNNLVSANPAKKDELYVSLKKWRKQTNAPIPTELNPTYQAKDSK